MTLRASSSISRTLTTALSHKSVFRSPSRKTQPLLPRPLAATPWLPPVCSHSLNILTFSPLTASRTTLRNVHFSVADPHLLDRATRPPSHPLHTRSRDWATPWQMLSSCWLPPACSTPSTPQSIGASFNISHRPCAPPLPCRVSRRLPSLTTSPAQRIRSTLLGATSPSSTECAPCAAAAWTSNAARPMPLSTWRANVRRRLQHNISLSRGGVLNPKQVLVSSSWSGSTKHLGTHAALNTSMFQEASQRAADCKAAHAALKHCLFGRRDLHLRSKIDVATATLWSMLFHNATTWTAVPASASTSHACSLVVTCFDGKPLFPDHQAASSPLGRYLHSLRPLQFAYPCARRADHPTARCRPLVRSCLSGFTVATTPCARVGPHSDNDKFHMCPGTAASAFGRSTF